MDVLLLEALRRGAPSSMVSDSDFGRFCGALSERRAFQTSGSFCNNWLYMISKYVNFFSLILNAWCNLVSVTSTFSENILNIYVAVFYRYGRTKCGSEMLKNMLAGDELAIQISDNL